MKNDYEHLEQLFDRDPRGAMRECRKLEQRRHTELQDKMGMKGRALRFLATLVEALVISGVIGLIVFTVMSWFGII